MPEQVPKDDGVPELNRVDDPVFHYSAHAVPLRLFYRLPAQLVTEAHLTVGEYQTAEYGNSSIVDGLHIRTVDSANVAKLEVTLPAGGGAFQRWDIPNDTERLGVNLDRRRSTLNFARMSGSGVPDNGDPVSVKYGDDIRRLQTTITRSSQSTQRVTTANIPDKDSIRDPTPTPDLDYHNKGHIDDPDALKDAIDQLSTTADHAEITADADNDDGWIFRTEGDNVDDTARFLDGYEYTGPGTSDLGQSSLFSVEYLTDVATALKRARVDNITVKWGEEWPILFEFFREEFGIRGHFSIAPRVESD